MTDPRETVAAAAHAMCDRLLTWGKDAGDCSLRDPDTGLVYILPQPGPGRPIRSWRDIGPDDVAVVDLAGKPVDPGGPAPTVELLTHLRVYQHRPDVGGVVHSHGRWSRVFAALHEPIPPLMVDSFFYTGLTPIACSVYGPVGSNEVALSAVECMGETGKAALLANHGAVCVGRSLDDALEVAVITEDMARLALLVRAVGRPRALTVSDVVPEGVDPRQLLDHPEL